MGGGDMKLLLVRAPWPACPSLHTGGGRVQEQPDLRHWRQGSIFKHRTVQSVRDHPTPGCGTHMLRAGRVA